MNTKNGDEFIESLIIDGRQFFYHREISIDSWYKSYTITKFFIKKPEFKAKKLLWFKYSELISKPCFTIPFNIKSSNYTKEDVKKALDKEIALLNRKDELSRGEII